MAFFHLLLNPLFSLYEQLLAGLIDATGSIGWSIVLFGLIINIVLAPLYAQMERTGASARAKRAKMDREIERMKEHFTGRERYFYINTVHRHFGFRPISVLWTASDLYLQVFTFVTVYRFLSRAADLSGAPFGFIADLGQPDALLFGIPALQLVMTGFNLLSAFLYTQERSKRRTALALAGLFLVLLYFSPAGLVLYWTTNNLFSLVRNALVCACAAMAPRLYAWLTRELAKP